MVALRRILSWVCIQFFQIEAFVYRNRTPTQGLSNTANDNDEDSTFRCYVPEILSREEAMKVMDETILPASDYDQRIQYGGEAQEYRSKIVTAKDPRSALTYGEFPPWSMDELIDLALEKHGGSNKRDITLVDLGSGCGRLVFYAALTRGFQQPNTSWTVHGIEISKLLHDEARRASLAGIDNQYFQLENNDNKSSNKFELHWGPAQDFSHLLQQADLVFAYSTVFEGDGFSEELGAIVLSREWNDLLSRHCKSGAIVITTDRALDPNYGWKLVDRLDVENREVFGSTGYIHILQEQSS